MIGQTPGVGVNGAHWAGLAIERFLSHYRIVDRAIWAQPELQLCTAGHRHETAVAKQRISLVDVEPLDGGGCMNPFSETQIRVERGEKQPSPLQGRRRDLSHS